MKIQAFPRRLFPKAYSNIWKLFVKNSNLILKKHPPIALRRVWWRQPPFVLYQQRLVFSSHCSKILEVPSQTPLLQPLSFSLSITDRFLCSLTSICGSTRSDPVRSLFCSQDNLFAHLGSSPLFQLLLLFRIPSTTSLSGISSCFRIWVLILSGVCYRSCGVRAFVASVSGAPLWFWELGSLLFRVRIFGVFN